MAAAVLFLLLAIWMQELALMGLRVAALIGFVLLIGAAIAVFEYQRTRLATKPKAALAALGRVAHTRPRRAPQAVRILAE